MLLYDFPRFLLAQSASGILLACAGADMASGADLMITESWVSVEDVAKHLGVARDSVYRWIESRRLPAHKIGRLWKFKLSEVDEWVRAGGADAHDEHEHGKK